MESLNRLIVTIDGPAGSGKSTLAQNLAEALGIGFINTGLTYRALALKAILSGIDPSSPSLSEKLASEIKIDIIPGVPGKSGCRVLLDGADVGEIISSNEVSMAASNISEHSGVRSIMVELQRKAALKCISEHQIKKINGIVIEGRDAGTVIFPDADVKIFLIAKIEERARRRIKDFDADTTTLDRAQNEILKRDLRDESRSASPLAPAPDSFVIDNSDLQPHETLQKALEFIQEKTSIKPG